MPQYVLHGMKRGNGDVKIVAFGVDPADAYATAASLGIDAVMTDSPRAMRIEKKSQ